MGTITPNRGLSVPTIGGDAGVIFAQEINGDLTKIDQMLGGVNIVNVTGVTTTTLTLAQSQFLGQSITGTPSGNCTVLFPKPGIYAIQNGVGGGFSLAVGQVGGGNLQLIPQGLSTIIWLDGQFARLSNSFAWQDLVPPALPPLRHPPSRSRCPKSNGD